MIARRFKEFAGTRFLKRGANDKASGLLLEIFKGMSLHVSDWCESKLIEGTKNGSRLS